MSPIIVMVAFYSTSSATEKLATAVAVGAVEKRAAIRMRRMPDVDIARSLEPSPEFKAELERMSRHYVTPTELHVLEADVLVFGVHRGFTAASGEWRDYLDLLARLGASGKLRGKIAVALGSQPGLSAFADAVRGLGLIGGGEGSSLIEEIPADGIETATQLGRRVVEAAATLKGLRE